ncbi:hypothetical protein Tco_1224051, partial [Tanacetum coccineum]
SGSASRQAQLAEPVVGQDALGGSGVGAVIGLSVDDGQGGAGGVECAGVGVGSQVPVTETRNADEREMDDGLKSVSIRRIQCVGYSVLGFLEVGTTYGYTVSSLMDMPYWLSEHASYSACKYVKLIQELLGYVRETCLDIHKPSEKLVVVTPINKRKAVSSMFDARHELCFLIFVFDMNASSKSKSVKKAKMKEEWKPTGKVFTKIRYNWRPIGRTFTLVGNACPLTRITATNKVPLWEPIPLKVVAQESVVTKVYTRRPKVPKSNGSNSKPKIAESVISNKTEPGTSRGSNTSVASSSSSVDLRLSKLSCGIWTPDALST